ncbi:MAG TPA: LptA/OstA family protein, partial [Gemmatimonadaceae bacterium]|nr:LptA/OstA family protein [Gemmatimonadaceae bacterium]
MGQGNNLTADSAEYYESQGRLFLIGNVRYTEPRATVTSNTMTYYQNDNHLHAEGNVVAVMSNGSVLRGPSADYYRSTPSRPLQHLYAPGRPTVTLVQKDTTGRGRPPDTAHVVANAITMDGDSLVYASGRVQITRPDLQATGDSAFLDSGRDFARLMREPQVQGKGNQNNRNFTLTGGIIDVYSRNRQVERVIATPTGHALSQDLELVADSIDLRVQGNQLQRAIAWGKTRARAVS